ncbi:MAG: S8 family serine peptidase, partial [Actinomycetota bacterium]|nr:S8 family serine peptidase [Actinomycetota bacterium]
MRLKPIQPGPRLKPGQRDWPLTTVIILLVLGLTGVPGFAASPAHVRAASEPAGEAAASPRGAAALDLASHPAERWIVQLADPPAARYQGGVGVLRATAPAATVRPRLAISAPGTQAYLRFLHDRQRDVTSSILAAVPGAQVERSYQLVLNGLGVRMSAAQAALVRRLPSVRAVTPDIPFRQTTYATPQQVAAPAAWEQLGGINQAGAGVKIAVIDSGIYVTRDREGRYVGNPCFDDAGYTAPPGYPK